MSAASIIIIIDDIEARLAAIRSSDLASKDAKTLDAIEAELKDSQDLTIGAEAMATS